ncbi:pyrimidine 5'-nucleotidase [Brevundimonas sp.]|uniref:pyrimidine 5'-nucleotidase n=1 Tax=Brevundimonas sp. TaxID=1871086 RepID=UPI002605CA21|nr:pyrimidine 5'-nucleotidase [Brevundimonas sp.]
MSGPVSRPDLGHINAWVFDLDDTLYPPEQGVMSLVQARINAFMVDAVGLPAAEAKVLQRQFLNEHGTTLAGLMANYAVDPEKFLREVHDVPLDSLEPSPALAKVIAALPGRKFVLTNGARSHAARVLDRIGIKDLIDGVFAIEDMDLTPKPAPATYRHFLERFGIDPAHAVFFEDTARNLQPARAMGMTTVLIGTPDHLATRGLAGGDWIDAIAPDLLDFLTPYALKDAA